MFRSSFALLLVLGSASLAGAQDLAGAKKFFDQSHLPTVSSIAPTDGQVLTWDSTLKKAKWAAGSGGGSFDPAAATAITFTTGVTTHVLGPTDDALILKGNVNGSGVARAVTLQGANGGAAAKDGADINLYAGSGNTTGQGGFINATAGGGDTTGSGGDIYFTSGGGGSTSGDSGSIYFNTPAPTAGNSGSIGISISDAAGTNKSAGDFYVQLGAKTGSGTDSSFLLKGASAATVFKVAYDGTVTASAITGTSDSGLTLNGGLYIPTGSGNSLTSRGGNSTDGSYGAQIRADGGVSSVDGGDGAGIIGYCSAAASGSGAPGGSVRWCLAQGDGAGANGSFNVCDVDVNNLFSVSYDGTITGPVGSTFNINAATPASSNGNNLTLRASAATSTNGDGGEVKIYSGNATGSSEFIGGGIISLYAGNGGATSVGGSITRQTGNGGSTSGASGSITDTIGSTTDGNVGSWAVVMPSATGTNRSGGVASFKLGAKTGSGTDGYFTIKNALDANLLKVGYDGTVTGPTGAAFNVIAATSQNLNLTAPNQILFNSAGDYMRMGNAFLNLSSAGGLAFCTESTATTIGSKLTYAKANYGGPDNHYLKFTSDLTGSEADEPAIFQLTSINNPGNLIHTMSVWMDNGAGVVQAYSGGAWSSPASLQLAAGGTSLTISDSSNSFVLSHTRLDFGSGGPQIRSGSGSPESSVTAPVGSVYLRTGGGASTTFYVKESGTGNTGWVAK